MSAGIWDDSPDSRYGLNVILAQNIQPNEFPEWNIFPTLSNVIDASEFNSFDLDGNGDPLYDIQADEMFESVLSLSIDVNQGDSFYLYTRLQAFAINGGYIDSLNTLETRISAFTTNPLSGAKMVLTQDAIAQKLAPQNRAPSVSEPNSILILLIIFGFLCAYNNNKTQQR